MIQYQGSLPPDKDRELEKIQLQVNAHPTHEAQVRFAKRRFKRRNRPVDAVFSAIRAELRSMCRGATRCMYCEDSAADEIEHVRPQDLYPGHSFVWENYLYVCGPCNGRKKAKFAVLSGSGHLVDVTRRPHARFKKPAEGGIAFLHPRADNPLDFIWLDLKTFQFVSSADEGSHAWIRGNYTIKTLKLDERDDLQEAIKEAYGNYRARLREYIARRTDGADSQELHKLELALRRLNHPTVWHEMKRQHALIPELNELFGQVREALTW